MQIAIYNSYFFSPGNIVSVMTAVFISAFLLVPIWSPQLFLLASTRAVRQSIRQTNNQFVHLIMKSPFMYQYLLITLNHSQARYAAIHLARIKLLVSIVTLLVWVRGQKSELNLKNRVARKFKYWSAVPVRFPKYPVFIPLTQLPFLSILFHTPIPHVLPQGSMSWQRPHSWPCLVPTFVCCLKYGGMLEMHLSWNFAVNHNFLFSSGSFSS